MKMSYTLRKNRILAFILFLIFCFAAFLCFPTMEVSAIAIADDLLIVALLGTLLLSGGIVFASTQDMNLGVNGFYEAMQQDLQMKSFMASLLAAPVKDGVVTLGSDLAEGWSYFWDHANEYFGLETGTAPTVDITDSTNFISSFVTYNGAPLYPYAGKVTKTFVSSSPYTLSVDANLIPVTYSLINSWYDGTISSDDRELLINSLDCCTQFIISGKTLSVGWLHCNYLGGGKASCVFSLDNFKTIIYDSYTESGFVGGDFPLMYFLEYTSNNVALYYATFQPSWPNSFFPYKMFDSSSGSLAGTFGGSICPDYKVPEDNLYTGQDVFFGMESVLQQGIDVPIDIGSIVGALEGGLSPDIPLGLTQSDVIPDVIVKEIEGTITDPTPSPSPSPSPTPKPEEPDIPKEYLLPDVTRKFPFCLPFDLIKLVEVFNAEPKPLYFEIPINFPFIDFEYTMVCDFADFEPVSKVCRLFITLEFILALILITRKIIGS